MRAISLAIPFVAAGMMFAQTVPSQKAAPSQQNESSARTHHARNWMMHRMTARLNLTADQQAKTHAIFKKTREETRALAPQLKAERQELRSAIKADSVAKIDQVTMANAQLNAKVRAIHSKGVAEFYAILTPAQKAKFDQRMEHRFGPRRMENRHNAETQG